MKLSEGAKICVEKAMEIKSGENALIFTDDEHKESADALVEAVLAVDAIPMVINSEYQVREHIADPYAPIKHSKLMIAAIQAADVILQTASDHNDYMYNMSHTPLFGDAQNKGTRVGVIDDGMADWEVTPEDAERISSEMKRIAEWMKGCDRVHVTAPGGTDISFSIKGRDAFMLMPQQGTHHGPIPNWSEIAFATALGSANGKVVPDDFATLIGVLTDETMEWTVKDNQVVAIEGSEIAKTFKGALERAGENAFHFSEFGFGASDKEKLGQGHRSKSMLGTVHFGLGDSTAYPGGTVHAATHLDGIIREARIEVDGKVMVENYTLKI